MDTGKPPACALLLTGGGARAAYQVGVLKAITRFFPRNHGSPFPIICGTSAGAINATALACYASCFHLGVKKLEWVWKNFRTAQVYRSSLPAISLHLIRNIVRPMLADYAYRRPSSLLDNAPLRDLMELVIDFKRIDRNILNGNLSALAITASCYSSGDSITFFQGTNRHQEWQRAKRRGMKMTINPQHLLASSALPAVFPTVRINQNYYGDGSIHQLAPLSAPIHLGAEKIFIIGVEEPAKHNRTPGSLPHHPTLANVAGHMLDSIFTDTLKSDLERLVRINHTLARVPEPERQKLQLRQVQHLIINPSENFKDIAADHYASLPGTVRALMRVIGINPASDSSLLSYLLFEKAYCQRLIALGFEDTIAREREIREFVSPN